MVANDLLIAVAVLWNSQGQLLTARKRRARYFTLPGGKIEQGESPLAALLRELEEELELRLAATHLTALGEFRAPAANEPQRWVRAHVYLGPCVDNIQAHAELEQLRWVDLGVAAMAPELAPLLREHIVPELLKREVGKRG